MPVLIYYSLGSPTIDGQYIFDLINMCICPCVMIITQSTTVLITHGPVQKRGQLVMCHVYIMYIYFLRLASKYLLGFVLENLLKNRINQLMPSNLNNN